MLFIDTTAFFAVLDEDDQQHAPALNLWVNLLEQKSKLITSNYVLLETSALLQRRIGLTAVMDIWKITPLLQVDWLTADQHRIAVNYLITTNRRRLSLVDCTSFETMRRLGIHQVFTFDKHFTEQGFEVIP
ncbi:MAG: PIN domain-containing protein [Chloroflexota bacterium]